ncbi:hypothetical protein ILYODFUR_031817 [Ilyodon furcidens]|uniref:Uncharacterized protein n=1 Tax=Ilyodon furcidens TaxID=33524 RepID=A0ABV0UPJ6_9TELE
MPVVGLGWGIRGSHTSSVRTWKCHAVDADRCSTVQQTAEVSQENMHVQQMYNLCCPLLVTHQICLRCSKGRGLMNCEMMAGQLSVNGTRARINLMNQLFFYPQEAKNRGVNGEKNKDANKF